MKIDVLGIRNVRGPTLPPMAELREKTLSASISDDDQMKGPGRKDRLLSNVKYEILIRPSELRCTRKGSRRGSSSGFVPFGLLAVTFAQPAVSNIYPSRVSFSACFGPQTRRPARGCYGRRGGVGGGGAWQVKATERWLRFQSRNTEGSSDLRDVSRALAGRSFSVSR